MEDVQLARDKVVPTLLDPIRPLFGCGVSFLHFFLLEFYLKTPMRRLVFRSRHTDVRSGGTSYGKMKDVVGLR